MFWSRPRRSGLGGIAERHLALFATAIPLLALSLDVACAGEPADHDIVLTPDTANSTLTATLKLATSDDAVKWGVWYFERDGMLIEDHEFDGEAFETTGRSIWVANASPGTYFVTALLLMVRSTKPVIVERVITIEGHRPLRRSAPRLRVLLACDTNAEGRAGKSAVIDQIRMKEFFEEAYGDSGMLDLTLLAAADVTPDRVIAYYRQLESNPSETLVFYYSGHGKIERNGANVEHFLKMTHGGNLRRSDLRREMRFRPHRCLIMLTDCCSSLTPLDDETSKRTWKTWRHLLGNYDPEPTPHGLDRRTVDALFLQRRGIVDITSASPSEAQFSWSLPEKGIGGFFTYALVSTLRSTADSVTESEGRGDKPVTWRQVFEKVRTNASALCLGRRSLPLPLEWRQIPEKERNRLWQRAHAFSLE